MMCLGAGDITGWAARLPAEMDALQETAHDRAASEPTAQVRGDYDEAVPMARHTWFGVGGPADVIFSPADAADLGAFLAACPADIPVLPVGAGSNLLVRDGGIAGVVIRLANA